MKFKIITLFIITLLSCKTSEFEESIENYPAKRSNNSDQGSKSLTDAWINNRDIERKGDTLIFEYYLDTITVSGPGKYLSHGGESGNNTFFGASLIKPEQESIEDFLNRLRIVREEYCDQTIERCSDASEYYRGEQNLDIIKAYYLYKENTFDEALEILIENHENGNFASRKHDLIIGILIKKFSRIIIEKELESIQTPFSNKIIIKGVEFNWNSVSNYHYAEYVENDWSNYFRTVMNQIEKFGI